MTANRQKRSSTARMPGPGQGTQPAAGVGGRHSSGPAPAGQGGYPDICTTSGSRLPDPRLADLRAIGLGGHWLRVAAEIGVDAFVAMWQILSADDRVQDDCGRVHIPSVSTYLRYQRNLMIGTMAADGLPAPAIRRALIDQLGYDLSERYIRRLMQEHGR